jgi:hypothetical protein
MRILYKEQTDGCKFIHGRNGREFQLQQLPRPTVDVFYRETKIVYEILSN